MIDQLLTTLTDAVSYAFRKDATCPGITISNLKNKGYYSSIVRYGTGDGFKNGKKIICKCTASSLDDAIKSLTEQFLKTVDTPPNPIDALKSLVQK